MESERWIPRNENWQNPAGFNLWQMGREVARQEDGTIEVGMLYLLPEYTFPGWVGQKRPPDPLPPHYPVVRVHKEEKEWEPGVFVYTLARLYLYSTEGRYDHDKNIIYSDEAVAMADAMAYVIHTYLYLRKDIREEEKELKRRRKLGGY